MNANLYRIIFNPHRGHLMAVSEHVSTRGKTARGERTATGGNHRTGIFDALSTGLRPVCLGVLAGIAGLTMGSADAQVIADPNAPGNQRPTVLQTANGLPQINIQTPSAAGVSRNTYSQFDIQSNGAILNNSRTNTQTQLAGWVQGNPWLAAGSARVIVNEVNSANPSQLRGYIEVAGQRAELIIANPAGVLADGAGFINANRVTLTTGTPQFNGGNLEGFLVQRGTVTIDGRGLDASLTDYTGILARAVQLNAGIWAKELKVVTGANRIDANRPEIATTSGSGAAPVFALDVAQLGGMYAGKISLIGTESGVGVRNAGVIGATAGDVVVRTDGWLTNSGSIQASANGGSTRLSSAGDIHTSGTIYAAGDASLSARGDISISGLVGAQGHTAVLADGPASRIAASATATTASGLGADGTLRSAGDLHMQATSLLAHRGTSASGGSTQIAGSELNLNGAKVSGAALMLSATGGGIDAANANVTAQGGLSVYTPRALRTDGAVVSAERIDLSAQSLSNVVGKITQTGAASLAIRLPGTLDNTGGILGANSTDFTIGADTVTNGDGTIAHVGTGTLAIDARSVSTQGGEISSNGALSLITERLDHRNARSVAQRVTLATGSLDNRQGEIVQLGSGQTSISAAAHLDNTAGLIQTNGAAAIDAAALTNTQGRISSAAAADIAAASSLDNTGGTIAANGTVVIGAQRLTNTNGEISAQGSLNVATQGDVANARGTLLAGEQLDLRTGGLLDNRGGTLSAAGNLAVATTGDLAGDEGVLRSAAHLAVSAGGTHANRHGVIVAQSAALTAHRLDNREGEIAAQTLNIAAGSLDNASGRIAQLGAADAIIAVAGELTNRGGTIEANGANLSLGAAALDNASGKLHHAGGEALALNLSGSLLNSGGEIATNGALRLNTQSLDNTSGALTALGAVELATQAGVNNVQGVIAGSDRMALSIGGAFANDQGTLEAAKRLELDAHAITGNSAGRIVSLNGDGVRVAAGAIDAQGGLIGGNGDVEISAQSIDVSGGRLYAGDTLALASLGAVVSDAGQIATGGHLTLSAWGALASRAGLIDAGGKATLNVASLDNANGRIQAEQLALRTGALANRGGTIAQSGTAETMLAVTGQLDNTGGTIASNGASVTLAAVALANTGGQIAHTGAGRLSAEVGALDNASGTIAANASVALHTHTFDNSGGTVSAGTGLELIAQSMLNNDAGTLTSAGAIDLHAEGAASNAGGTIEANQGLSLNALALDNHGGRLVDLGTAGLAVTLSGALNNQSGTIGGNGAAHISTQGIDNRAGAVVAQTGLGVDAGRGDLANAAGELSTANGTLSVRAANLGNAGGKIVAEHGHEAIALDGMLDNSGGTLYAGADLTIAGATTLINTNTAAVQNTGLIAGTNLSLSAASLDNQAGRIAAGNALDMRAGSVSAIGLAEAGSTLKLAVAGDYTHDGTLRAPAIDVSAANLTNEGILAAGERLTLRTGNTLLNRSGKVLFSGGDIALSADVVRNEADATIWAANDLGIAKGESLAAGQLTNDRGLIEAHGGNLDIRAAQVLNLGATPQIETVAISDTTRPGARSSCYTGVANSYCAADNSTWWMRDDGFTPISDEAWSAFIAKYPITQSLADHHGGTWAMPGNDAGHETEETWRFLDARGSVEQAAAGFVAKPGRLLAGSSVILAGGTIENRHSTIAAGGDVVLSGARLDNVGQELKQHVELTYEHWKHNKGHQPQYDLSYIDERTVGAVPALISAGGAIQGSLADAFVNGREEGRLPALNSDPGLYEAPTALSANQAAAGLSGVAQGATASGIAGAAPTGALGGSVATQALGLASNAVPGLTLPAPQPARTASSTGVVIDAAGKLDLKRLSVPESGLFVLSRAAAPRYLIETNPAFAEYARFVSSDYLLERLGADPTRMHKRLGDGFYEQQLVRDQALVLTGRQFLGAYGDWDAQYRALLDAGITYANAQELRPGIVLSPEQVASLTSDLVWLIEQEIDTPRGRERVLVPQLYLAAGSARLSEKDGAIVAAGTVDLDAGRLINSGRIQAHERLSATASGDIKNLGGTLQGGRVELIARGALTNASGNIAGSQVLLSADKGIAMSSAVKRLEVSGGHLDALGERAQVSASDTLEMVSGRDIVLGGVKLAGGKSVSVDALGDVRIESVAQEEHRQGAGRGAIVTWSGERLQQRQHGSGIDSGGALSVSAGRDLTLTASNLRAEGAARLAAGRDLSLDAAQERTYTRDEEQGSKKGFLSKKRWASKDESDTTAVVGSLVSADSLDAYAGRDLGVIGSDLVGTNDVTLKAGRDFNLASAAQTHSESHLRQEKTSGLFSSGGLSVTLGSSQRKATAQTHTLEHRESVVGSTQGRVAIVAGEDARIVGSDVISAAGTSVIARNITLEAAHDTTHTEEAVESKQGGLTLSLTAPVVTPLVNATQAFQRSNAVEDERLKALHRLRAANNLVGAAEQARKIADAIDQGKDTAQAVAKGGGVSVSIALGASRSKSESRSSESTARGARLISQGDITLIAAGSGAKDEAGRALDGDLKTSGATIQGNNVVLGAARDIELAAAKDTSTSRSRSDGSSAAIGVSVGVSASGAGVSVFANASRNNSRADGTSLTHRATHIDAQGTLAILAGRDATLAGAQARGETIKAEVGGDLRLRSLQDTATFESRSSSASAGVSIPIFGVGGASISASGSTGSVDTDYRGVREQTGFFAGQGGFDIAVKGHTELTGALIASQAQEAANRLVTGTLGFSDIRNEAHSDASSAGFALSSSMLDGKYGAAKALAENAAVNFSSAHDERSVTRAAISPGEIRLTRPEAQTQDPGLLSRAPERAHRALAKPDGEKLRRQMEERRELRELAVKFVEEFTDEAHRKMFKVVPKVLKVTCRSEPCAYNSERNPYRNDPASQDQADPNRRLADGRPNIAYEEVDPRSIPQDGTVRLAVNGIFNSEQRAAELAMQNTPGTSHDPLNTAVAQPTKPTEVYVVYYEEADSRISEFMVAFYEKHMAKQFGYTNPDQMTAELVAAQGQNTLLLEGHSRGSLVVDNALTILNGEGYKNQNLSVNVYGPAVGQDEINNSTRSVTQTSHDAGTDATYVYDHRDPVSTFVGGAKDGSFVDSLFELWAVFRTNNSAHSCYGTGAVGCKSFQAGKVQNEVKP